MKPKNLIALVTVAGVIAFSGCGQKEIAVLKTERDGLQAKLLAAESDRNKLASQIKEMEFELSKASNGFQNALVGVSNSFQLERAGLLLTNGFLAGRVDRLQADLDAQQRQFVADRNREIEAKKNTPVKEGLKALRKILDAATIGTSLVDYNRILIDSQGSIREALDISDPEIKKLIVKTDKALQDAKSLWKYCNELAGSSQPSSDPSAWCNDEDPAIAQFFPEYKIPKESSDAKCFSFSKRIALTTIWGVAGINLQQAEKLFSAQIVK